jgi:hypothetical protein
MNEANSTAARAGVLPSPVRSGSGTTKRKEPGAGIAGQSSGRKRSKVANDIREEVRVLLAHKLMSIDEEVKLQALAELSRIYTTRDQPVPHKEVYCCAVEAWHGGHFVLIVLRQELAKGDGARRDVVFHAIRFLANWNKEAPRCRDAMSDFKGIGCIVAALEAYTEDREIQYATICCFVNYTCDRDEARLKEIVNGNAIMGVVQALKKFSDDKRIVTYSVKILDRLQGASDGAHWRRLVKDGALLAVCEAIRVHVGTGDQVLQVCNHLAEKLCVP